MSHLELLYADLRRGNPEAREGLILANMARVEKIAGQFISRCRDAMRNGDDLVSVGNVALVDCIDDLANRCVEVPFDEIRSFIAGAIRNRISDYLNNEAIVGPRKSTQHKKRKAGDRSGGCFERTSLDSINPPQAKEATSDVDEAIEACCSSEQDKQVVELRRQGFSDDAISLRLNISTATVWRSRQRIEKRYNALELSLQA